jgi:flagellar biosynthesis GTPase FlhF
MTHLSKLEATLQAIKDAYSKLSNATLTQLELEKLVENSREIYERAVILHYKTIEENVFGVVQKQKTEEQTVTTNISEIIPAATEETQEEVQPIAVDMEFNFENQLEEVPAAEEAAEEEEEIQQEIAVKEEITAIEPAVESLQQEPVAEEETVEQPIFSPSIEIQEPTITSKEEEIPFNLDKREQHTPVSDFSQKFISHFSAFVKKENSLFMSKLDTLIGSFGLNERLLFINELFEGSGESFSDSIKKIDEMSSFQDALAYLAEQAEQNNWQMSSETVEEFVLKINRRHA